MSRLFDGVDDQVQWSIGACNLTGAWTQVFVIKLDAGVSWQSFLTNEASSTSPLVAVTRHSSGDVTSIVGGGANLKQISLSVSSSDGWVLIAVTRTAGTAQVPRGHKYPIGGSPTHTNAGGGQDNQATQAGGKIIFGQWDESDFFKGRLAVAGEATSALSDADIESLVTTFTRANWVSKLNGVWDELDAFATDHTGNGATRTSLTGTADDADDPTGWSSWAGAAATSLPPVQPYRQLASIYSR